MYNKPYVFLGILIFLVVALTPVWLGNSGKGWENIQAQLAKPKGTHCVENKNWMVANHMELLNAWRELAVRYGMRIYYSKDYPGSKYNVSLLQCWKCHNYNDFCHKCHTFVEERPVCWQCHYNPNVNKPTVNAFNIKDIMNWVNKTGW